MYLNIYQMLITHYRINITPEFMNVSVGDRQVRGMINAMTGLRF